MSVRFFLAHPTSETSSIDVVVRHKGQRYKKAIGESVETKYWSPNRQAANVTQRYRHGGVVNHAIRKWKTAIDQTIYKIDTETVSAIDSEQFWAYVEFEMTGKQPAQQPPNRYILTDYMSRVFIPKFLTTKSETRIKRFNVVLKKIRDFELHMNHHYTFDEIDTQFHRDLQTYMNNLGHSANYFGTVIKVIKQVLREAEQVDKCHVNKGSFSAEFKAITQEIDTIYLTTDELLKIYHTAIDERFVAEFYPKAQFSLVKRIIRSYNIVKNRFLIGAYTGLRMSDFNKITNDNIRNGMIRVVTEKTSQMVMIPIHKIVQEILDSGFDMSLSLSGDKTRLYIKEICKYAGIKDVVEIRESIGGKQVVNKYEKWQKVGSHTARRSFATNAYKAGVPALSIMKITGHKRESEFMKYIRIGQEENARILVNHPFFKSEN